MAGKGKAGKQASKNKPKRHHNSDVLKAGSNLSRNSLRRLAKKGGVKRIASNAYPNIRQYADEFLLKVVSDATVYAESRKGVTVTAMDVVYALKKNGKVLYGYGA